MKSVPNLISYLHEFSWNFSQFLAICFELFSSRGNFYFEKLLTRGTHLSEAVSRARPACQRAVSTWLPCARTHRAIKAPADHASWPRRRPDSLTAASPRAPPTAVVRSHAPLSAPDRACPSAPHHHRRPADPAASAPPRFHIEPAVLTSLRRHRLHRLTSPSSFRVGHRRARLGHMHAMQAGCVGTVQLGRGGFSPDELFFYFLNIIKYLQIQKFV
jgi:hypothetical protein